MRKEPLIVHPLPAAPTFTGREDEQHAMQDFWNGSNGVLSLIGLGGAGKTALAERFVSWLLREDPPDALFVWSFYDEPDANAFLQSAYRYLSGGRDVEAKGAGWFHLLKEALGDGGRYLLVLDGLERVQRPRTDASGIFGELEDPLLRGFLTRLCAGTGQAKAIITSRFPVSDIERWRDRGYTLIDVDSLQADAAHRLLETHGVRNLNEHFGRLVSEFGGHALTLDLLGGACVRFFGGDPDALALLGPESDSDGHLQERRLHRVLQFYEEHLPKEELALLCRLCIFRFGVDAEAMESIFLRPGREPIAGGMAGMARNQLDQSLNDLQSMHLTLRDGRGRFTIHPAVRDHFYRLFREPSPLHEAVSEHLSSLTERPGIGPPSDKATLDLLEELVHHAIQSGDMRQATEIYHHRLGGNDHLNAKLGEYVRTHRILRAFPSCPDSSAMYHCLRAFGRFEDALDWRPQNRYIRILTGPIAGLTEDPAETTRSVARFLLGEPAILPERSPDMPLPVAWLHLLKSDVDEARKAALREMELSIFEDDKARNRLVLAETDRRSGWIQKAREHLEQASAWILNSGSQEHLALLHLVRGRIAEDEKLLTGARAAYEEGLHTCQESGFRLLETDLRLALGRLRLADGDLAAAEQLAREAKEIASDPELRYAWGMGEAAHLLGDVFGAMGRSAESTAAYEESLRLRQSIGDPAAAWTERLIRRSEERAPA